MKRRRASMPSDVLGVARKVAQWRKTRGKRGRMPEELWQEAVDLARVYGVSRTAREVGLGYESLKGRVDKAEGTMCGSESLNGGFLEVNPEAVFGLAPEHAGAVVELHQRGGAKVVVRLPVGTELDVARIAAAVCGGGQ